MKKILFITPFDLQKRNKENAAAANRVDLIVRGLQVNRDDFICEFFPFCSRKRGIFKMLDLMKKGTQLIFRSSGYDYLYIYGEVWFPFLFRIAGWYKCKIIIERCEFPLSLISQHPTSTFQKFREKRFLNSLKHAWLFVSCSDILINYYQDKVRASCPVVNVPLVVDVKEFNKLMDVGKKRLPYITYCGNMGNNKDGVDILLRSFSYFLPHHKGYRLRLIGGASTAEMEKLYTLADELGIKNDVDFLGYMAHSDVVKELSVSSLLALSRPANKQAEGGMPSKLAEYLLTGNPTLVTDVGEISHYVKDGRNCFLSVPDSPQAFFERMDYVVTHPDEADRVARKGKTVVEQFDYVCQSERIAALLT